MGTATEMDAMAGTEPVPAGQQGAGTPQAPREDYDGPLLPFADFMNVLGEHQGVVLGATDDGTGVRLTVTELRFDLPMELRVRRAGGVESLNLRAGPPTQRVQTTVFPVLHRLRVRLVRSDEAGEPGVEEGTWHGPTANG
jgi:hypothetical protein